MAFYYDTEKIEEETSYLLGYKKESEHEHNVLIKVSPALGNNLYCFRVDEYEVVHYDTYFSLRSYYTGNPILYPFPNRLRNCFYEFRGKHYWHQKHGIPVFLHSLVYDEKWECDEPLVTETGVSLKTWIDINTKHPIFEGFPFPHTLCVIFEVTQKGCTITYEVKNHGKEEMPYGISYHTFFKKLCGDKDSFIRVPATYMMDLTDDLLPTGRLLDVEGENFDLRNPVPPSKLDLDNCYTGMIPGERVYIDYPAIGLRIYMDSTEDFTHMQVFTPKGKPFFCVEKQTCSTDAVNLDNKGFREAAHLLTVPPGEKKEGTVSFGFEFY
ncbi:aldose 1-epimerase [Sediminispirochaeta smaragdinae]|jgi:aldose 1-epimerase|uniref:Aldose 1-epimerase n=1 Tax=Sediminispirochaeta smaragdinae (strain DSM 11293 / JCM 15392 / SEBR 4228) TaxID=573413 RepID=E1R2T2_SEDSS|nr:aldose 1-epimerase [Sediminispirochaeta smaragdinae]ADK80364.1 Aldose 1-epimerase [Sediminispirochaeta smaragdinae DSM 11293]